LPEHVGSTDQQCKCGELLGRQTPQTKSRSSVTGQSLWYTEDRNKGDQKIVGGMEAEKHSIPWQIYLSERWLSDPFCGGTIIGPKTVLTASHCVENSPDPADYIVHVGNHDVTNEVERFNGSFGVESITMHPWYDSNTLDYDFAILKLKGGIEFSHLANAACLPTNLEELFVGHDMIVSGWGNLLSTTEQEFPDKLQVKSVLLVLKMVLIAMIEQLKISVDQSDWDYQ
jgi:secreted trypsin-like serine protease